MFCVVSSDCTIMVLLLTFNNDKVASCLICAGPKCTVDMVHRFTSVKFLWDPIKHVFSFQNRTGKLKLAWID